ncbi:hypothetical protein BKA70DRAFT_1223703 [Coprinopsis sp. MPI-PUGE-AT-0042]|nr:hypothetical protein BKA70DRAFT_1223703 [Coprinopsis sp. MPI-PUGE-AT-0042]
MNDKRQNARRDAPRPRPSILSRTSSSLPSTSERSKPSKPLGAHPLNQARTVPSMPLEFTNPSILGDSPTSTLEMQPFGNNSKTCPTKRSNPSDGSSPNADLNGKHDIPAIVTAYKDHRKAYRTSFARDISPTTIAALPRIYTRHAHAQHANSITAQPCTTPRQIHLPLPPNCHLSDFSCQATASFSCRSRSTFDVRRNAVPPQALSYLSLPRPNAQSLGVTSGLKTPRLMSVRKSDLPRRSNSYTTGITLATSTRKDSAFTHKIPSVIWLNGHVNSANHTLTSVLAIGSLMPGWHSSQSVTMAQII